MKTEKKLGLGIWGIGKHARQTILPAANSCPSINLVGIGTRNKKVRLDESEKYNCRGWDSLSEMLDCSEIEVVYLATPIGLHFREGREVLNSNKHLWSEKSFTNTLEESQFLYELATKRDLAICLSCGPIYHYQFKLLKTLFESGLGKVHSITAKFGFPHLEDDNIRYSRELGGSALLDIGFYPIVVLTELLGVEPIRSSSIINQERGYHVDTGGAALFEFSSNINAMIEWGYGRNYVNQIEIWGEYGTLTAAGVFSKPESIDYSIFVDRDGTSEKHEVRNCNQFLEMLKKNYEFTVCSEDREKQRAWALNTQVLLDRVFRSSII